MEPGRDADLVLDSSIIGPFPFNGDEGFALRQKTTSFWSIRTEEEHHEGKEHRDRPENDE